MGEDKWTELYSSLKELTQLEIEALKKENQPWLPSLETIPGDDAATTIMKAMETEDWKELIQRASWLYCWLLSVRPQIGSWEVFHTVKAEEDNKTDNKQDNKKDGAVLDYGAVFEHCATALYPLKCDVTLQRVVKDGGVYACILIRDRMRAQCKLYKIYLVAWQHQQLVAMSTPAMFRRRLHIAMEAALPEFRAKYVELTKEHPDKALLESVLRIERRENPLEQPIHERPVYEWPENEVPTLEACAPDAPQEASQPGFSKGSTRGPGAGFMEVDDAALFTQDYSLPGSSNGSTHGPGASAMEVDGAAPAARGSSQPGSSNESKPWPDHRAHKGRTRKVPAAAPVTQEASQPGSSKDSTPWIEDDDQPADSAQDKGGATRARQKNVSRPRVPKRGHGIQEGVSNEDSNDNDITEPEEIDPQAVYEKALERVQGLNEAVEQINSNHFYTTRTLKNTCHQLCDAIDEFCMNTARNADQRTCMLNAVREKLAKACSLFLWKAKTGETPFKKPVEKKKAPLAERFPVYGGLEKLWSTTDKNSQSDLDEMKKRLEDTYKERHEIAASPLPAFFLDEDILCMEAEIQFGCHINALEEKLLHAARVLSVIQNEELTLRNLCEFLEEGTSPSFVTQGPVPPIRRDESPRIYTMHGTLWIDAGNVGETVTIASGRLERALVLCLVLYYIKLLAYPEAFWRVLYVLQFILNPSDDPATPPTQRNGQPCEVTERMRYLSDLLTRNGETSGPEKK